MTPATFVDLSRTLKGLKPCLNTHFAYTSRRRSASASVSFTMSSKLIIRSCGSSIRTLLHCHLRLTVSATNIQTETPGSIYNRRYLLPNSIVPQTVHFAHGISHDAAGGYSVLKEAACRRRTESFDEERVTEDEDDDDIEMDHSEFDSDDSEFDSDDDSEIDGDDSGHWR